MLRAGEKHRAALKCVDKMFGNGCSHLFLEEPLSAVELLLFCLISGDAGEHNAL